MLIIADNRLPDNAKHKLEHYGEIMFLETGGIVYDSISGHPDIFFCQLGNQLVIAPNLPEKYKHLLKDKKFSFIEGEIPLGKKYPQTAVYNVVCTTDFLIHNFRYTDSMITYAADERDLIHVNQGYTRCNLMPVAPNSFITSDKGIERVLEKYATNVLYVNPAEIQLPGANHGFFGGCCGLYKGKLFIAGSLSFFTDGEKVKLFAGQCDLEIIELFDGPLFDCGSIMFVDQSG
ncbi:MAG: hypothetical protein KDC05_02240 [Bacteroidales bacterium]|nr:hypothetical protein [Bacteroidales bacterium]